jgi:hypothetical protein
MDEKRIFWRRLDSPGHDAARLLFQAPYWRLEGAAVFVEDGRVCRLDYEVACDQAWRTVGGKVSGRAGGDAVDVKFTADPARRWRLNGVGCKAVEGCLDVDLEFTPATNLLPIRRLRLPVGKAAAVKSAWLRFPSFSLEVLEQAYSRVTPGVYRYEAFSGTFVKNLSVDEAGFVTRYPGLWEMETGA